MLSTPSQANFVDVEEEVVVTPKTMPVAPKTPSTVCAPMQMAATPAPATEAAGSVERSFEERRLAMLSRG